jgi:S1-C subfamily serine protease
MAFGLISLLVVIGIMMIVFKTFEAPQIEVGQQAQQEAQQLSGRDANGVPAMSSYKAEEYDGGGGGFKGIKITDVTAGGAMDTYYGLKVGDIVMQINSLDTATLGDYNAAKGMLDQAYQEARTLTVLRNGATITLPVGGAKSPLDALNIPTH